MPGMRGRGNPPGGGGPTGRGPPEGGPGGIPIPEMTGEGDLMRDIIEWLQMAKVVGFK